MLIEPLILRSVSQFVQAAVNPVRSSTPTNQVYPVVESGYTPPPIEISPVPILGGPGTVTTSAAVASRTIVSENSLPEGDVEAEGESPSKVCFMLLTHQTLGNVWHARCRSVTLTGPTSFLCQPYVA